MSSRIVTLFLLIVLAITDIGPVPTVSLICIYIILFRPQWFKTLIDKIYKS